MTIISYAQNAEDVVLRRLFSPGHKGLYIDVGASDPLEDTVTRSFYEAGWRGINIEPGQIFSALEQHRPLDVNLNVGLSSAAGTSKFYEFLDYPGSSTCCAAEAEIHRLRHGFRCLERTIPVTTLKAVCEEHVRGQIDFISIDVEGHERQVLEGGEWSRFRPVVVVVEAVQPNTTIPMYRQWEDILRKADYRFGLFDGLNRYYIRGEDAHLLSRLNAPANLFDDFISYHYIRLAAQLPRPISVTNDAEPCSWHAELRAACLLPMNAPDGADLNGGVSKDAENLLQDGDKPIADLPPNPLEAECLSGVSRGRRLASSAHAFARRIRQLAKAVVKPLLVGGADFIRHRPRLKRPVLRLLDRLPAVRARLVTAAARRPPACGADPIQNQVRACDLGVTAGSIYQELLRMRDCASREAFQEGRA